jgi:hypothetical protein
MIGCSVVSRCLLASCLLQKLECQYTSSKCSADADAPANRCLTLLKKYFRYQHKRSF